MGDIRGAIQEVRRENRKKYAFLILVILIVGGTLWMRGPVNTQVITYTNPNRLSYELPELNKPNIILTQQKFIPAACENNGTIQCREPVVISFFVQDTQHNLGYYEHDVHVRLKNTGKYVFNATPSLGFRDVNCFFIGATRDIPSNFLTSRLDFSCPATGPLEESVAFLTIKYNDGAADKQENIVMKLQ